MTRKLVRHPAAGPAMDFCDSPRDHLWQLLQKQREEQRKEQEEAERNKEFEGNKKEVERKDEYPKGILGGWCTGI